MSIRKAFQVITFVVAFALSFSAVSVSNVANACDPHITGFC
jgi:hypothetical protein